MKCQNKDCKKSIEKGNEAYFHGKRICQRCDRILRTSPRGRRGDTEFMRNLIKKQEVFEKEGIPPEPVDPGRRLYFLRYRKRPEAKAKRNEYNKNYYEKHQRKPKNG